MQFLRINVTDTGFIDRKTKACSNNLTLNLMFSQCFKHD